MIGLEFDAWVSAEYERVAQLINEYNHNLQLAWIPPGKRTSEEDHKKCFVIIDTRHGDDYVVMTFDSLANPQQILADLFYRDYEKGDVLARLEADDAAARALQAQERREQLEAVRDLAAFAVKNEKNYWKHNGKKYDSEFREIK